MGSLAQRQRIDETLPEAGVGQPVLAAGIDQQREVAGRAVGAALADAAAPSVDREASPSSSSASAPLSSKQ